MKIFIKLKYTSNSKMTMYVTSTLTSPVTKTAKMA